MYTNCAQSNGKGRPYMGNHVGGCCIQRSFATRNVVKEEAIPNIVNEETWKTWKNATYANMNQDLKRKISYNFAHFLNCKLN